MGCLWDKCNREGELENIRHWGKGIGILNGVVQKGLFARVICEERPEGGKAARCANIQGKREQEEKQGRGPETERG